jgi:hypothetical protein
MARTVDSAGTDQPIHFYYWGKLYHELALISKSPELQKKYINRDIIFI